MPSMKWPSELRSDLEQLLCAGPPLTESQQIGRGPIIDDLAERLLRGEVKKLYEARRVGKTTVARAALRRFAARDRIYAELNLAIYPEPREVASELASQLAAGLTAPAAARSGLQRLLDALPSSTGAGDGEAGAILAIVDRLLEDSHSPARVLINAGQHARGKLAVFVDEAHTIASWPSTEQEAIGAALRDLSNLGVIIASSDRHALQLLSGEAGPLRYVGDRFSLPAIAEADCAAGPNT